MRRLLPPFLFLLSAIAMSAAHTLVPIATLPGPLRWPGLLLLVGGLTLTIVGNRTFARVGTNIMTFDDPDVMVTDGVFAYSRNPMYLGFAIALWGLALTMGSLSPLLPAIAFVAITDRWYIRFEEQAMARRFGDRYRSYQTQTRRWL